MDREARIDALLDKQEISECILRFSRGIDRHDIEVARSAFHDDARDDHGVYIGTGHGVSVREMLSGFERAVGRKLPAEVHPRRPGDVAEMRADYGLKDSNDGHVAHAAITGKADAIVTDDRRAGFKTASSLREANVEIVLAKEFASNTVAAHPQAGVRALVAMSERRQNPRQTPAQILHLLVERYGMDEVVDILRPLLTELR